MSLLELSQVFRANNLHGLAGRENLLGCNNGQEEDGHEQAEDSHECKLTVILEKTVITADHVLGYLGNIGGISEEGDNIFSDLRHVWWSIVAHLFVVDGFIVNWLNIM